MSYVISSCEIELVWEKLRPKFQAKHFTWKKKKKLFLLFSSANWFKKKNTSISITKINRKQMFYLTTSLACLKKKKWYT